MQEPSVWDYVKALLTPWRGPVPEIPPLPEKPAAAPLSAPDHEEPSPALASQRASGYHVPAGVTTAPANEPPIIRPAAPQPLVTSTSQPEPEPEPQRPSEPEVFEQPRAQRLSIPWATLAALLLALIAQRSLEPEVGHPYETGLVFYLLAFAAAVFAAWKWEWAPAPLKIQATGADPMIVRLPWLIVGTVLALAAFLAFGGHRFTFINTLLWVLAVIFTVKAFWIDNPKKENWLKRLDAALRNRSWRIRFTPWTLLVIGLFLLIVFFRVYRLEEVPPQMVSDHAEKLLDVGDVLNGNFWTFFPRNTGREFLQMYLTAAVSILFGTGLSFISLKIGTVLAGLITLPFIYLLGKEVANKRVGLLAMTLAGIAYWPNVLSRIALRFSLYPLFVAPALYFLVRGIRRSSRNDFIISGLFLGLGLHGYTPYRIMPFVVVAAVLLFVLHKQSLHQRKETVYGLIVLGLIALIVFIPLLRYAVDDPALFAFRAFSRAASIERPLPGPAIQIFLENTWRALTMFAWDDGEIWVVSVTHRPALDVVSAAFFYLGIVILGVRYARRKHWLDLFLILAVPLLMMPSILSLAYPNENPAPNRAGGAMVVVFLIAAIAFDGFLTALQARLSRPIGPIMAGSAAVILVAMASAQNYDLVFRQYERAYELGSWNTTELGAVIRDFAGSIGTPDTAWVVAYPYWVDTRLVGMNAGYPAKDYAIQPDQLESTQDIPGAKLFLLNIEDQQALAKLSELYPDGWLQEFQSQYENKNFLMYFIPPES